MSATAPALQEFAEDIPKDDVDIIEPACNTPAFFTGVRMHVVNGITHLMFYCEQPGTCGDIEFMVVARLVGTAVSLKASLDRIAARLQRPVSVHSPGGRPLN